MTGEMDWIGQDGTDDQEEIWELHAAVAKAVNGKLYPFDKYRGPFILVGEGELPEEGYYKYPVEFPPGLARLWIFPEDDYFFRIWREDNDTQSRPIAWWDEDTAVAEAKRLLSRGERGARKKGGMWAKLKATMSRLKATYSEGRLLSRY
jgi:hypothetical protein